MDRVLRLTATLKNSVRRTLPQSDRLYAVVNKFIFMISSCMRELTNVTGHLRNWKK